MLGTAVECSDGPFGELVDIVIDPLAREVTHVVVEPHHRHWMARLVPIGLLAAEVGDGALALACTIDEARKLEHVEHSSFVPLSDPVPVQDPDWDIGAQGVLLHPYYALDPFSHDATVTAVYDRIPKGEVEIRRASSVRSADGHELGRIDGFIVDDDEHITHLLLEHGHLWGKREIAIAIGDIVRVRRDAIELTLTRDAVGRLEPVRVRRWHGP